MNTGSTLTRRGVLAASVLAAASVPALVHAAPLKVADRKNLMATYARMRGAKNDGLALWWYTGTVWGKPVDDVAVPMFLVQGLTFNRLVMKPDGTIEQALTGRGWYADPKTGKPLEKWKNPYTGEQVVPPHIKSLQKQTIRADGTLPSGDRERLDIFSGGLGSPIINGDTIWMTENFVAKSKPDETRNGAVNTTSSLSTFTAKVADVENDEADFVPCFLNYQSLGSWPVWMKMDGVDKARGGSLSWQTRGHKVRGPEAASADLRAWIEERRNGFLANPGI